MKIKSAVSLLTNLVFSISLLAQPSPTEQAEPIVAKGKQLYYSEMTSWYGTDLFLEKYKGRENIGGYASYSVANSFHCIFVSTAETPVVIGEIIFDSTFDINTAKVLLTERPMKAMEKDLIELRNAALQVINTDTLFKSYKNSNLNLIPLINGRVREIYVLTGPSEAGVVVIGNDYHLLFDSGNKLLSRKKLHQNIIFIAYGQKDEEGKTVFGTMHTHLPESGDFITETDICTLMLYGRFTGWKRHIVVSEKYMNIWSFETNSLTVTPNQNE